METIDNIRKVPTSRRIIHSDLYKREINLYNVPDEDIVITKITILRTLKTTLPKTKTESTKP